MAAPTVFISYSHDSAEHADRVLALSNRLRADGIDCILDQYETSPPENWPRWMDNHIRKSDFVLMVCTDTYCRRVTGEEEPGTGLGVRWEGNLIYQHIYNAGAANSRFVPVLLDGGGVEHIPTPVQGAMHYLVHTPKGYEDLYRRITNQPRVTRPELGKLKTLQVRERKPDFLCVRVSTAKLPSTNPDLFGRDDKLKALDKAWENPGGNVLSLVAFGGVGKTALVNKWLLAMGQDGYRGAERVYGWSFYSQGAAEGRQVSADQFIAAALTWFGDPDPTAGSPWDKGERLAELVKRQRTLLILDGLEPLQNPPPVETGKIKDPGLCSLLRELARQNPGLVVISTRLPVDDLKDFKGASAIEIDLDNLSPKAGAEYLKHLGVKGTEDELKQTSKEFGGHALALTLLGRYLADLYDGDIRRRGEIPQLMEEEEKGGHARRIMRAYESWFEGKPEDSLLHIMGLFDRPAEKGAIDALLAPPVISGLTDDLQGLKPEKWKLVLKHLRKAQLLADPDEHDPDELDCHPLVREHFGKQLREGNPEAWREAHSRLYAYYFLAADFLPDTIEGMGPLFAAISHGYQAGLHAEAYDDVYLRRILRGSVGFTVHKLGAFGADLAAISGFFDPPWSRLVGGLREDSKAFLLNAAGFRLRALGRLAEAVEPMRAGLDARIAEENWKNAAISASSLSELHLVIGDLRQAVVCAEQGVHMADRSKDAFRRIVNRSTLADALYQAGRIDESAATFRESERMQMEWQPLLPLLYSLQGFRYCDFLLGQTECKDVQSRAARTLAMCGDQYHPLGIALDNLSLGRAHLMQAQVERTGDYPQAAVYLDRAVDGLRQAGAQEFIARGLLARAELYMVTDQMDRARRDLDEAFSIATRCGMRLFEADCHLEYARFYLASSDKKSAREHLDTAARMIDEMGYHRRDPEVKELEQQLL